MYIKNPRVRWKQGRVVIWSLLPWDGCFAGSVLTCFRYHLSLGIIFHWKLSGYRNKQPDSPSLLQDIEASQCGLTGPRNEVQCVLVSRFRSLVSNRWFAPLLGMQIPLDVTGASSPKGPQAIDYTWTLHISFCRRIFHCEMFSPFWSCMPWCYPVHKTPTEVKIM